MQVAPSIKDKSPAVVKRLKDGDQKAFRELYDQYARAMFSTSMRILNHEVEAEEVLQDSFLSAFRNISSFEGRASFGSWLKRIVINKSIDVLKKRRTDFVSIDDSGEVLLTEEEVSEEPTLSLSVDQIMLSVQELPVGFRTILTLFLFENYSHKMIAEELGISESTSKSQYLRARRKLADLLSQKHMSHE